MPALGLRRSLVAGVVAIGLVPSCLVFWILWLAPIDGLAADRAALAARDFSDLWAAGRLATEPAFDILYHPARLTAFLRASFGSGMPAQIWPYPPPTLLLAAIVARVPILPGFVLYTSAGLAMLGWAVSRRFRSLTMCAAILLSPAVADNALAGQNGVLTAAAMLAGLVRIDARPRLAGILLGLLVLKPQLALILPVCLIAGRRWQVLLVAGLTAAAIAGASAAIFGLEAWTGFVLNARPEIATYFQAPWTGSESQRMFVSVFMAMRALGADLPMAYAAQALTALLAASLVWAAWRRPAEHDNYRLALTMIAALVASPWTHDYDMPTLAVAIVLLLPAARPWHLLPLALAWIWPGALSIFSVPAALPCLSLLSLLMVASQVSLAIGHQGGKNRLQCV